MINRETTVSKEIIHEGKILTLEIHDVKTDLGNAAKREIIRHPGGVVILGYTDEGKIPFVEQFRKPFEDAVLELPAGKLDDDEDPLEAARREFQEETGYHAREFVFLGEALTSPGYSDEVLHIFRATGLIHNPIPGDEDESFNYYELTKEEVRASVQAGTLRDAKSLCALYLDSLRQQWTSES